MITINMLKRDCFGRVLPQRVEASFKEGHAVNAFFLRGGRTSKEFSKLPIGQCQAILRAQQKQY